MTKAKKAAPVSTHDKMALLRSMADLFDLVSRAVDVCYNEGWLAEGAVIEHWRDKLDEELDKLRAGILKGWIEESSSFVTEIDGKSRNIQKSMDDLKDARKVAETVVKIAGYVDDAVRLAGKLLKAV